VLLSGGETTVTLRGRGRGGRNAEFLLALAIALGEAPGVYALAADTDGIDGSEHNAGCILTPDSLRRAAALGMQPKRFLQENDGYGFFAPILLARRTARRFRAGPCAATRRLCGRRLAAAPSRDTRL
jgi:hydroxypyruvate reductase